MESKTDHNKKKTHDLEQEKLLLEIRNLKHPFYKKTTFWGVLIPSFIAFVSVVSIYLTGFIDAKKAKLELERTILQVEIAKFEKEKTNLKKEILRLRGMESDLIKLKERSRHLESAIYSSIFTESANKNLPLNAPDIEVMISDTITLVDIKLNHLYGEYRIPNLKSILSKIISVLKIHGQMGDIVDFKILGNADAVTIPTGRLKYRGEFGSINSKISVSNIHLEYVDEIIQINEGDPITNKHLALLRALSVFNQLIQDQNIDSSNIQMALKVHDHMGSHYRQTNIKMKVKKQFHIE